MDPWTSPVQHLVGNLFASILFTCRNHLNLRLDFVTYCFCLLESVGNRTLVGERPLFWKCQGIVEMSVKTVHIAYFKSATTLVFIRLFRLDSAILIKCFCLLIHLFNVLRLVYR